MSTKRLLCRIPEAEPVEAAHTVDRYEFTFVTWSKRYDRAVSGIVQNDSGRQIFGALYKIPWDLVDRHSARPGRKTLDAFEGEGSNYTRAVVPTIGFESGTAIDAFTYFPNGHDWMAPTDDEYATYILDGLSEWRVPDEYVHYVKDILSRALQRP